MRKKYLFIDVFIRNGEYEYSSKSVHETTLTIRKFAKDYAKDFYLGKADKGDGGYYFNAGEVFVQVYEVREISLEDYKTLLKYL